jgi:hypothetical protein
VVRNVYAHVLDARRVGELVADLPPTLARLHAELTHFAESLDAIARG